MFHDTKTTSARTRGGLTSDGRSRSNDDDDSNNNMKNPNTNNHNKIVQHDQSGGQQDEFQPIVPVLGSTISHDNCSVVQQTTDGGGASDAPSATGITIEELSSHVGTTKAGTTYGDEIKLFRVLHYILIVTTVSTVSHSHTHTYFVAAILCIVSIEYNETYSPVKLTNKTMANPGTKRKCNNPRLGKSDGADYLFHFNTRNDDENNVKNKPPAKKKKTNKEDEQAGLCTRRLRDTTNTDDIAPPATGKKDSTDDTELTSTPGTNNVETVSSKPLETNSAMHDTRAGLGKSTQNNSSDAPTTNHGAEYDTRNATLQRRIEELKRLDPDRSFTPVPQKECYACLEPLPQKSEKSHYQSCCGLRICGGCLGAARRLSVHGTNVKLPIKDSEEEKIEFMKIATSEKTSVCPICYTEEPTTEEETLKRLQERINDYNDREAMNVLGKFYLKGECGLSQNFKKAKELYKRSYELGDPAATKALWWLHHYDGHFPNEDLMLKYLEEGVKLGENYFAGVLANIAIQSDNHEKGLQWHMTAASFGHDDSMYVLKKDRYKSKMLSEEDFTATYRAYQAADKQGMNEASEYTMRYVSFYHNHKVTTK